MGKFAEFLKEQDNEKPYRILIVMRDVPDDPNKTGDALVKQAKKWVLIYIKWKLSQLFYN